MKVLNKVYSPNRPTFEYFPRSWDYFVECMLLLKGRGANFITMSDAYAGNFCDDDINVILDHHIDFYPVETEVMARWEAEQGILSSIYLFNHSPYFRENSGRGQTFKWDVEDLNIPFYQELEGLGFEIGYHSNCVGQAQLRLGVTLPRAVDKLEGEVYDLAGQIFERDVENLSRYFNLRTFVPHGAGESNNKFYPLPEKYRHLIWAYNNHRAFGDVNVIPRWRNYSDSNLDLAQVFRVPKGKILCNLDNLKVFCATASAGLHHLVLHPGRYSAGMPYDMYLGPTPVAPTLVVTSSDFGIAESGSIVDAYRFCEDPLPLDHLGENFITSYYCFSDCEVHLSGVFRARRCVVGFFLAGERLDEREAALLKIDRSNMSTGFRVPDGRESFLKDFKSFINKVYSKVPLHVLSDLGLPLDNVFFGRLVSERYSDISHVVGIIKKVACRGGTLDVSLAIDQKIYFNYRNLLHKQLASLGALYADVRVIELVADEPGKAFLRVTYG